MNAAEIRIAGSGTSGYRREIDGLRAIAVLAVILFHTRMPGFSSGFVGVDIFLVISGYLIAALILRESDAGTFTLIGFYERRARRILPALLAVLVASGIAGWIMLPIDFQLLGQSLTAISLFASNLLFWHWDGYFSITADSTPLIHTWSLAVEEQFYIVFPTLLLLARRGGPRTTEIVLATAALASFVYSVWATGTHPEAAFYSPLSRAWEFLAGALLAASVAPRPSCRWTGDSAAGLGIALIVFAVLHLGHRSSFPGFNAVAPVLGSVLILFGTEAPGSRVAHALSSRPLVAIGLISYSLYLWHWPLIVFGSYYARHPYGAVRIAMALLAFPIAWLSWRYIEMPFRMPRLLLSRRTLFAGALMASAGLGLYGALIWSADGFPGRVDPAVQRLSERGPKPGYGCVDRPVSASSGDAGCLIGGSGPHPSFVLWGDSHAAVYFPALDALARRSRVSGYQATRLGCPPLIAVQASDNKPERWKLRAQKLIECRAHNERVLQFIAKERPLAVLIAGQWSGYALGRHGPREQADDQTRTLEASMRLLHELGIRVYIVQDVPGAGLADPRALAKALLLGTTGAIEPTMADYLRRDAAFRRMVSDLERRGLVEVIEPSQRLCDRLRCRVTDGGYPLYYDTSHLNARGAQLVAPVFDPLMRFLAAKPAPRAAN
ncbi:MAG: acyltransferase family protein [Sphingomonas sp.]